MSRYDFYGFWEPTTPIRTDEGIKARSKRGSFASSWWAKRWIEALEQLLDAGRLSRGRSYARRGQVLSIEPTDDGMRARVQGSRLKPYRVTIRIRPLTDAQWERVIEALASQARFVGRLMAGEMPHEIEGVFEAAGVSLLPEKGGELETECSCPDWSNPCKHSAATHYILAEQLDEDPFLLFQLRGRSQARVLEALRARRAASVREAPADAPEEVTSLEATLDHFWELGAPDPLRTPIQPPATPLPILRRLGQPPFLEEEELEPLLGPALRAIGQAALAAGRGEPLDESA
jgi:uncharacterized Zn finger protein